MFILFQEIQEQERLISDIEEEHKSPVQSTPTRPLSKENENTSEPAPLVKSLSFDSSQKVYSKDDSESSLKRASTAPTSAGRTTLPRDSKLEDWLQPKIVRFDTGILVV